MDEWSDDFNDFMGVLAIIVLASMFWGALQADIAKRNGQATTTSDQSQQTENVTPTQQYQPNPLYTNQGNSIYSSQYMPSH